jgi:hypothetical protein
MILQTNIINKFYDNSMGCKYYLTNVQFWHANFIKIKAKETNKKPSRR